MISTIKKNIDPLTVSQRLELNFCPRCGHALQDAFVFNRQRRVCPACGLVVFRDHKVAAAVVVANTDGEVLLIKRAGNPRRGYWGLPAGFVDFDETPAEAAVRECHEETGLQVGTVKLLTVTAGHAHQRGANIIIVYEGLDVNGTLSPADDALDACFFPLDALPPLAFSSIRQILMTWREHRPA
ncbi:MAG TPA: NUDIX hydrolase [Thermoflexia bacterium]|nr:NUDIX hydrolase [Thermoflexia bacterium]